MKQGFLVSSPAPATGSSGKRNSITSTSQSVISDLTDSHSGFLGPQQPTFSLGHPNNEPSLRLSSARRRRSGADPQALHSSVLSRRLNSDPAGIARLDFQKAGLVGREEEETKIHNLLQELMDAKDSRTAVMQVAGPPGVGKTYLASHSLESFINSQRSHGASSILVGQGKFDLNQTSSEPLSALKRAMKEVALQLLNRGPSRYDSIMKELENEMDILRTWLPSPDDAEDGAAGKGDDNKELAMEQLRYVTARFLSQIQVPVVVLVDDVQWADNASLQLLSSWVNDPTLNRLMVLLCYRDNEVNDTHDLNKTLLLPLETQSHSDKANSSSKDIANVDDNTNVVDHAPESSKAIALDRITLHPLVLDDTHKLVSTVLSRTVEETLELAELVHKKTNGNPFHLVSFLLSLQDKSLITFNLGDLKWKWSMETLRKETTATENVVELLQKRLSGNEEAQSVLPIAAILGATFSTSTVVNVFESFQDELSAGALGLASVPETEDVANWLSCCYLDGYIDQLDESDSPMYRFTHDSIQEAALSLLEPTKLTMLQYLIGNVLAKELLDEDGNVLADASEHLVYTAANLVNVLAERAGGSVQTLPSSKKKSAEDESSTALDVMNINIAAGNLAMSAASFSMAADYFNFAIDLFPENFWQVMPKIAVTVFEKAAWAEYSSGNHAQMKRDCEIIIQNQDLSLFDKVRAYHILMQATVALEKNEEALEMGLGLLEELGVRFPKGKVSIGFATVSGLMKAKRIARRLAESDIAKLPIVTAQQELVTIQTLDILISLCYSARTDLIPLCIVEIVSRTTKHGVTPFSASALAQLGLLMAAALDDFETTKACYHHSKACWEMLPAKEVEARTHLILHQYTFPWFMPQSNSLVHFIKAYEKGIVTGDLEYAGYSIMFHLETAFYVSRPLHLIDADCRDYSAQLKMYSQLKQRRFVLYVWQAVTNLRGMDTTSSTLSGDIIDFEAETKHLIESKDLGLHCGLIRVAIFFALCVGDYQACANLAMDWTDAIGKNLPAQGGNIQVRFCSAFAGLVMAQTTKDRKYKKLGLKNASIIHSWMKKGNPNCVHMDTFLDAEKARLKRKYPTAIKYYEYAVVSAGRRGYLFEQALASERCADLLFQIGNNVDGMERLKDAIKWYQEWGAFGKASMLDGRLSETIDGES